MNDTELMHALKTLANLSDIFDDFAFRHFVIIVSNSVKQFSAGQAASK